MRRTRRKGAGLCGSKVACKVNNGRRNNSRHNRPITHVNPLRTGNVNINVLMRKRNAAYNAGKNTSAYNKQIQNYLNQSTNVNKISAALAKPLQPLTKAEEAKLNAELNQLMRSPA